MSEKHPDYVLISSKQQLSAQLQQCLPAGAPLAVFPPKKGLYKGLSEGVTVFIDCLPDSPISPDKDFFRPFLRPGRLSLIMICEQGDLERVRQGILGGAHSYVTCPLSPVDVQRVIHQCISIAGELDNDIVLPDDQVLQTSGFQGMLGASTVMKKVYRLVSRISRSESTVLIQGESGTGKELVAKAIHSLGSRAEAAFIPVNCAAIPRELLESELFGYVKGAFTGALGDRIGRVEMAGGGVLFLDEIGEMEVLLQVKILRLLQERTIEPLGWRQSPKKVDVRIISATNKNLDDAVQQGDFREDLFFRLNVVPVQLPPLRDRLEDIPCLVDFFIGDHNRCRLGEPITGISREALQLLQAYRWPGNIRELENVIERVMVMKSGGLIMPTDLPEKVMAGDCGRDMAGSGRWQSTSIPAEGVSLKGEVSQLEKDLILQALQQSQGVKEKAAKLLKMNRTTLIEKIKRNRIDLGQTVEGGGRSST
ncbi:MAG: sigma-54-dependent Fis family transcriptional regulator [Deltaproteobacteria bacterium]|nr:sigma-54-dependent Fis family transcriptional regulator [Candidatus Anaeroferrophillus wilburensis]MBN2888477.1 sigma-54-dependent Fis family transcriptional regulator [Deltaproteobacteria bacterium]